MSITIEYLWRRQVIQMPCPYPLMLQSEDRLLFLSQGFLEHQGR